MIKALYQTPYLHIEENWRVFSHRLDSKRKQDELFSKYKVLVDAAIANWGQVINWNTMLPEVETLH